MQQRNGIRSMLASSFKSVQIVCLPSPTAGEKVIVKNDSEEPFCHTESFSSVILNPSLLSSVTLNPSLLLYCTCARDQPNGNQHPTATNNNGIRSRV
jgi:hypothetical protein